MTARIFQAALLLFSWSLGDVVASQSCWYNIQDFGAKGDDKTINTEAMNAAVTQAARNGGGTVFFPAGNYRCKGTKDTVIPFTSRKQL